MSQVQRYNKKCTYASKTKNYFEKHKKIGAQFWIFGILKIEGGLTIG